MNCKFFTTKKIVENYEICDIGNNFNYAHYLYRLYFILLFKIEIKHLAVPIYYLPFQLLKNTIFISKKYWVGFQVVSIPLYTILFYFYISQALRVSMPT